VTKNYQLKETGIEIFGKQVNSIWCDIKPLKP
jgi:hypothetical protein